MRGYHRWEDTGDTGHHEYKGEEEDQQNKIMFEHAIIKSLVTTQSTQVFSR